MRQLFLCILSWSTFSLYTSDHTITVISFEKVILDNHIEQLYMNGKTENESFKAELIIKKDEITFDLFDAKNTHTISFEMPKNEVTRLIQKQKTETYDVSILLYMYQYRDNAKIITELIPKEKKKAHDCTCVIS